ncbi:MAG: DJ-1/PfpI family protein [Chitinophagaceae bacterium]
MKKLTKASVISILITLVVSVVYFRLQPVRELNTVERYAGDLHFHWKLPTVYTSKRTVLIIADNDGTEIFDLLAPFYLFNATEKANVFVVSEKKSPIILDKGLYILPQMTFAEVDSLKIRPDVIVIPNQSVKLGGIQKEATVSCIKNLYTRETLVLSVCHGSATAAATGIYDSRPLTTHATNFTSEKKQYPKPIWVKDVSITQDGNLYSTAGVSNATEGCLAVIKTLFGKDIMKKVIDDVRYPSQEIKKQHESLIFNSSAIITLLSKVLFRNSFKIGVLLQNNINEFELASTLDTYNSTAPSSIKSFVTTGTFITSKYGLILYPTCDSAQFQFNETHVLMPDSLTGTDYQLLKKCILQVNYHHDSKYILDKNLDRIASQYGVKFQHIIKLMLDYN